MTLSNDLEQALQIADDLSFWIVERWPTAADIPKTRYSALASFSIAKAHYDGIRLLLHANARTAASALVRPMLEATLRGFWFRYCETTWRKSVGNERALPSIGSMIKPLSKIRRGRVLGELKGLPWEMFSDLTHGGDEQINNWLSGETVEESHPDSMILFLISAANCLALIAANATLELAGRNSEDFVSKIREVIDHMEYHINYAEFNEMQQKHDADMVAHEALLT